MYYLKKFIRQWTLIIVLATLLIGMRPAAAAASGGLSAAGGGKWRIVSSPNVGQNNTELSAMATISSHDIWAVGVWYSNRVLSPGHTLTEHWNGTKWSIVPSPNGGPYVNFFSGVAAVSTQDVWAVGTYYIDRRGSGGKTLIEHWNGTRWSVVPSPNAGTRFSELYGVTAVSASNVWAVGNYISLGPYRNHTLVEHWDGSRWSVVPSPNPGASSNSLDQIAVVSADDIWAVGDFSVSNGHNQTLTEHWNGTSWSVVASPNVGRFANFLRGIAVISAKDIWAVGLRWAPPGNIHYTLVVHWNGTKWSVVPSPNPDYYSDSLAGVAVVSSRDNWASRDIWAVGTFGAGTLVEHWNGRSWSVVPSPNKQPPADGLAAVGVIAARDIWAVGFHITPGNTFQTLSEQCC